MLLSTPGHKIYSDGEYQSASELTTSSELLSSDGKHLHPSSVSSIDSTATLYNFEVSDYHNYYAGDAKVLVHNECAWAGIKQILVNSNKIELFDKFHDAVHALNIGSSERKLLFTSIANLGDNAPKFILGFIDSPSKLSKFAKEAGLVEAWAKLSFLKTSRASKLTQDIDLLKIIQVQRKNGFIEKIGSDNYDEILKKYAGQCKVCNPPSPSSSEAVKHLAPHDEMLVNLEKFINKHQGKEGVTKVIDDIKSTDPRKQKGAEFVIRILKEQEGVSVFEFKYMNNFDNTSDFVLNGKNIDGKSWGVVASIDNIGGWQFSKQLKDYFNNGNFELWFDYSRFQKSTNGKYRSMSIAEATKHIKKQYQKLFSKNNYNAYNEMIKSKWLKGRDIYDLDDFIEAINDVSDDFYSFIKVK